MHAGGASLAYDWAVADDPFFPPPEPRGGYRERQERPVTAVEPVARTSRPVVAKRPESDAPARRASRDEEVRSLPEVMREEREFAARNSFANRHPRVIGAFVAAIGAFLMAMTISTLRHGGLYSTRSAMGGPFALSIGLFVLAFGIQRGADHRPTRTWTTALFVCSIAGGIGGMILLSILARR